ncbi:MAG: excinuclease ABC subunit A, partial [Bacteroidales bacterium]|nr:excinuclease ABC subunit A [Bacteroidales bacterium]
MHKSIVIKGAKLNNLKNINLEIPRDKLVVITGISGSGKSTLAFDTIFAEGQRRFVESLSSFARQFLGRMTKPDVDEITGIPPAIAIEQKVNTRNPRSTVGTTTEIYEYLRLLYSKIGKTYSPVTGKEVKKDSVSDVVEYINSLPQDETIYILAPIGWEQEEIRTANLLTLKEEGYTRLWSSGEILRIERALSREIDLNRQVYLLVDRVKNDSSEETQQRLFDSITTAFSVKKGTGQEKEALYIASEEHSKQTNRSDKQPSYNLRLFSTLFERDGISFEEPSEPLFSYNNPIGACPNCSGYGKIVGIDPSLVVPNPTLTIYEEAIACWRGHTMSSFYNEFIENAHKFDFPIHKPYKALSESQKELLWKGNSYFTGINKFFEHIEERKYKIQYRIMLSRYSGKTTCPQCEGKRLRREALYVKIAGKNISELLEMSIEELYSFLENI